MLRLGDTGDSPGLVETSEGNILIVDDHPESRELLQDFLVRHGYQIHQAGNGARALEWLRRNQAPSLVLLDLTMPVMDGWALREALLEEPAWAAIPVVLISARRDQPEPAAVRGRVQKPIDLDVLLALVQRVAGA